MRRTSPKNASALLLVLTSIAVLALVIIGVVQTSQRQIEDYLLYTKRDEARRLAESGIAFALHPQIEKEDPLYTQKISSTQSFEVKLLSEGARLNINHILAQNDTRLLVRLFRTWDLPLEEAQPLVDALADWVDPDGLRRLNGAEKEEYESERRPTKPSNLPFQSVDEMENVIGMEKIQKLKPDWKDSFTVWSEGPLDLNEASAELISLVTEVGLPQAETLVQYRTVEDPSNPEKPKNRKLESLEEAGKLLGLSSEQLAKIGSRITMNTQTFRIQSTGILHQFRHQINCVVRRNSVPIVFLLWSES